MVCNSEHGYSWLTTQTNITLSTAEDVKGHLQQYMCMMYY